MKISVITATWNGVETVGDCLASVAGQSYPDVEHILIDGGSRDGTREVLQAHRERLAVLNSTSRYRATAMSGTADLSVVIE
jgi:glycosyltransferase